MIGNALLLALRELRRNVMRSVLTMLGIIIGVAAVIILVTLGSGATRRVTDQIASLGSNLLMLSPGKRMGPGQVSGSAPFKLADAQAIARDVPGLAAVAPTASRSSTAIYARENWATTVTGTTDQYFISSNRRMKEGRAFTASEARLGGAVCVIGETVRAKLFGGQNPVGSRIRLQKLSCEIIGLMESKGQSSMGMDQDDLVLVPLRTFQRRIAGNDDVGLVQISVLDSASTERARQEIRRLMRARRHLSAGQDDNFNVMDMKEITAMLSGTTRMLTALLGAVAAVSLLVGGIGIMNIMLVSVTERTREIGTPPGHWRPGKRGAASVPGGGGGSVVVWRGDWDRGGLGRLAGPGGPSPGAVSLQRAGGGRCVSFLRGRRGGVRIRPGAQSRAPGSH